VTSLMMVVDTAFDVPPERESTSKCKQYRFSEGQ
jgi:hypothetical protein